MQTGDLLPLFSPPKPAAEPCAIAKLPTELMEQVFCFLDGDSLLNARQVSRRWLDCVDADFLWRAAFSEAYAPVTAIPLPRLPPVAAGSWRSLYTVHAALDRTDDLRQYLNVAVDEAAYEARRGHAWSSYAQMMCQSFSLGTQSFLKMGFAPFCFAGAAVSATAGVFVGAAGSASGLAMMLSGAVCRPLFKPGAMLLLGSFAASATLGRAAVEGAQMGKNLVTRGVRGAGSNYLYALDSGLSTLFFMPSYLYRVGFTRPRQQATLRCLRGDQGRIAARVNVLQHAVDRFTAAN
jgi:hypothetical protein